jgi:hypothetical protein
MKTKTVYLIVYNDCYGNGDTSNEGIIEKMEDFEKWLENHNKDRITNGDEPEGVEEFDKIPIPMYTF